MVNIIIQALLFEPNMSEQEKKWQRIYVLLNAETKLKYTKLKPSWRIQSK